MPDPMPPPKPGAPIPPPKPTPNQIDGEDAAEIGEFISAATNEMQKYDNIEMIKALNGAKTYARVSGARIKYDMTIQVSKAKDGVRNVKERNAEIEVQLDINNISAAEKLAPFELVNGVIGPAEVSRPNIEAVLIANSININNHTCPMFAVSTDKYWVYVNNAHIIVDTKNKTIETIQDLNTLTNRLLPMFQFMSSKLDLIY